MVVEAPASASGLVVALLANYAWVALDHPGPGGVERLLCTRRTRLGKSGQQILSGDRVVVDGIDWVAARGAVTQVFERHSVLERPAVANVSRVVVVAALAEPALDPLQLTRFLITAEATGQSVELVLSKADALQTADVEAWCVRIRGWGYDPVAISTRTGQGLDSLRQRLRQPGLTVLCGPSGVGKSSLLNALMPALALRVAAVSGRLKRGRHTTRHVELFALAPGALVADTPGFNRPLLPTEPSQLPALFPELRAALAGGGCRYGNCRHQGEPGCSVGSAWDRAEHFGRCLVEVEAEAARQGAAQRSELGLRQRGSRLEPRLQAHLRQPSRRRQRQDLDLTPEDDDL